MGQKKGGAMRIIYCIPHLYNSGGMERVLTQKVNWLATHTDYLITILTTESIPEGTSPIYFPLHNRIQTELIPINFDADYQKPLFKKWFGHMRRMHAYKIALVEYIRKNNIDLCISLGGKEVAFLSSLPCRTMVEFHFSKRHREQLIEANHTNFTWHTLGKIRSWQLTEAVRKIKQVVVLTQADKKEWEKAGCRNVICIPNPCYLDGLDIQKHSDLSDKNKLFLAVGRLHEQKGFDMLIDAWQNIENNYPDWHLRIVGEGEQRKALEQQIKKMGMKHVTLAGRAEDMQNEYASASCFILSSRYEGLPLSLIEAMWWGIPCVAFDCPNGPKELLGSDRGILIANGDIQQLYKQMEYIMTHIDEAAIMAQKGSAYARKTFCTDTIMPKWVELIEPCK